MKEPALLEPIELTDAELDMVSGGQYSVTVDRIAFFGLSLGGGTVTATANSVTASGGMVAAAASGIQGLMVTL
jgi:dienelactone hydrolase